MSLPNKTETLKDFRFPLQLKEENTRGREGERFHKKRKSVQLHVNVYCILK